MEKVSVVILNYNGRNYLEQFLPSLITHSQGEHLTVVDNASDDNSIDFLHSKYPDIDLITLPENLGYAGGYNTALRQIKSEYYVLLNSDIEVTENWLAPMINLMEENRQIAAVQPKIKSFINREYFEYAGAAGGFIDFLGYPFCRGRIFQTTEKDDGQYDNTTEVFWASGACLAIRAENFHESGGFDPDFFAHMEEIDLCWRLQNKGFRVIVYPGSVVYHLGAGTLPVTNPRKTFLNFNNNLAMLTKNLPGHQLLIRLPLRLFLDWIAALKFLADGSFRHCLAVVRAHINYLKKVRQTLKKKVPPSTYNNRNIYPKSIVFDYFLAGRKVFVNLHWKQDHSKRIV